MRVLVLGSGGREHALAWALRKSPRIDLLYCAPGNAGIARIAEIIQLDLLDFPEVARFCKKTSIDRVIIGPEAPLALGIVDFLQANGIKAFGPTQSAAMLESSKIFTKNLCRTHKIPTARFEVFSSEQIEDCRRYIEQQGAPIVIKADGLAAGKGVIISQTVEDAKSAVRDIFAGQFGKAGRRLVIEEFLTGREASIFVAVDGVDCCYLGSARDYKRALDGDAGPNTGGMGAYSPADTINDEQVQFALDRIIKPTIVAMANAGNPYRGILYAGLMVCRDGVRLIEYNVRFGDPECQVLLPRLKTDILAIIEACLDGRIQEIDVAFTDKTSLAVVLATRGYPGELCQPSPIGIEPGIEAKPDTLLFHAATRIDDAKLLWPTGGRVLNVVGSGRNLNQARQAAYESVDLVTWRDLVCRTDIGCASPHQSTDAPVH